MAVNNNKKKRLRFSYDDDVILLRETVSRSPYKNGSKVWDEIRISLHVLLQKEFNAKTIRQHVQMLLDQWKDSTTQKRSGDEEPYSEKDVLLQEVSDLIKEEKEQRPRKAQLQWQEKINTEIGRNCRDNTAVTFYINNIRDKYDHDYGIQPQEAIQCPDVQLEVDRNESNDCPETVDIEVPEVISEIMTMTNNSENGATMPHASNEEIVDTATPGRNMKATRNILGPIRKRAKQTNYIRRSGLEYLKEKHEKENELEEKRLRIEERKVAVAEREKKSLLKPSSLNKLLTASKQSSINC